MLEALQKNSFRKVVTRDESWFYLETEHSAQWSVCRNDMATKTKLTISTPKFMLTVMWRIKGFHVADLMTSQNQFNSQYFVEHVMVPIAQEIFPHGRNRRALPLHLHLDNSRVHFSKVAEQFLEANDILRILHPPYSPDLVPSDFWLFGRIKTALTGAKFDEPEQLLNAITEFLNTISVEELRAAFDEWAERVRCVTENEGVYYQV
jgi:histone-lysine N-methyltransferase SETMAR